MNFSYYFPNKDEKAGCVTRALSKAYNKDCKDVEYELKEIAKELNYEDYREVDVFEEYMFKRNAKVLRGYENKKVSDFSKEGCYILFAYKDDFYHLVCIKDNTLYDKDDVSLNLIILKVYEIR